MNLSVLKYFSILACLTELSQGSYLFGEDDKSNPPLRASQGTSKEPIKNPAAEPTETLKQSKEHKEPFMIGEVMKMQFFLKVNSQDSNEEIARYLCTQGSYLTLRSQGIAFFPDPQASPEMKNRYGDIKTLLDQKNASPPSSGISNQEAPNSLVLALPENTSAKIEDDQKNLFDPLILTKNSSFTPTGKNNSQTPSTFVPKDLLEDPIFSKNSSSRLPKQISEDLISEELSSEDKTEDQDIDPLLISKNTPPPPGPIVKDLFPISGKAGLKGDLNILPNNPILLEHESILGRSLYCKPSKEFISFKNHLFENKIPNFSFDSSKIQAERGSLLEKLQICHSLFEIKLPSLKAWTRPELITPLTSSFLLFLTFLSRENLILASRRPFRGQRRRTYA